MTKPIHMVDSEQARSYMAGHKPDEYTLLDVRQDWEHEEFHLPGARLIPLPELPDRAEEVDKEKPVLVYCASGGRSMAAAAFLDGQGVGDVMNLVGGIMAWQGDVAYGPMDLGMIEFSGTETPAEVVFKAYAMENTLQSFYSHRAEVAETVEDREVFTELAGFEERHMKTLYSLYARTTEAPMERGHFEQEALNRAGALAEGGVDIQEFIDEHAEAFAGRQGILQVAAMVEAQALDYYLRCAMRANNPEARKTLQIMAREEKAHLKLVGKFMDRPKAD